MGTEKKDRWDRFSALSTFLSTVVIAVIGLYFTHSYNSIESQRKADLDRQEAATRAYQTQILEMQTMEKFIPYLTSKDEETKKVAVLMISTLASSKLATNMAQLYKSKGTKEAVDVIMASAQTMTPTKTPEGVSTVAKQTSAVSERSGWVYLGDYDAANNKWNTRYLSFDAHLKPDELANKTFAVRNETGAVNVRLGMPTDSGEFLGVVRSLKPMTNLHIEEVKPWLTTGYTWARVTYSD